MAFFSHPSPAKLDGYNRNHCDNLTLVKIFLDPCLAVCHLFRDSSMTIIDKITAACLPVITITRRNQDLSAVGLEEEHPLRRTNKDMEKRIGELEKRVNNLQMLLMANKAKDENQPA